jgi:hypothetical protein
MTNSQGIPKVLMNGIYLQEKQYDYHTHLDSAHLMVMEAQKERHATDLGMITPWITTGYLERPGMWNLIGKGKNRMLYSDGTIFKWKQPIAEQPTYILEDVSGTDKPGVAGTTFKIKLNKRTFGNSAIITANKFSALELYVTAEEIYKDGDGFIYTVKMTATNKKFKYFPKEWLTAGTIFFQIGSVIGEYGQTYNDMGTISSGHREFYNYVGEGHANAHLTVTREAALSKISKSCVIGLQQYRKVVEMYQLRPGSAAFDISRMGQSPVQVYMEQYAKAGKPISQDTATAMVNEDIVKKAWIPEVEMLAKLMIERDVENYAMWGSGGTLQVEGNTAVRLPIGLFHQLNMGMTFTYNIAKFTLARLEAILTSRLKDKIDPYGQNEIVIGTGLGGLKIVRKQILDVVQAIGLTFDHERYVKGTDNQALYYDGPNFLSYRFSFGIVRFEHVPALDPIEANDLENPFYDGHRLSSYMYIIDDLTAQNDNIYEIVYAPDFDFHHYYINGRMNYMDNPNSGGSRSGPYQASNTGPGFEVYLEKRLKCYHIIDITKSLLIKPYNPYTGKPLFEPYFA